MNRTNLILLPSLLAIALSLCACVAVWDIDYGRIKPVFPKPLGVFRSQAIDTLTPTLEWESNPPANSYDLKIWKAVEIDTSDYRIGQEVYHKKGIQSTRHQVELVLEADRGYYWSVKANGEADWSKVDTKVWAVGPGVSVTSRSKELFFFRTPQI